jgi:quinol-cytochrome oxidoreductase complex cytochrome b subunit
LRTGDNAVAMSSIEEHSEAGAVRPEKARGYFNNLLLHFRPAVVPERTLRLSLTWGLGGAATVLLFLLFGTGLLLKFVFEPFPDRAYDSILYLQAQVPFGQLIRNLHRWSGNLLVLAAFLHLLRVFYTGAIDPPRRLNWLIGVALFAGVLLSNFTGYLLPWDQIAFWAVTISSSMLDYLPGVGSVLKAWVLGGPEPGSATLMNFYVLHTAVLPALLIFVLPFHFWRVRKAHGLVVPRSPDEPPGTGLQTVNAMPHLIVREVSATLILLAGLLIFSMLVNAPLAEPANPGLSPNPTKAPWYFMGLQELLLHFHPVFSVFVIPALLLAGVLLLPWLVRDSGQAGVWFQSGRGRVLTLLSAVVAVAATAGAVLVDESLRIAAAGGPRMLGRGLVPLVVILAGCAAYVLFLGRVFRSNREESIQALFTLAVTALVVLTLIGVWFRGAGMQLGWAG